MKEDMCANRVEQETKPGPSDDVLKFFPGFKRQLIETSEARINTLVKGDGPPLLLLHGFPENHLMWREIAPQLAEDHTVVVTDLRGYGDSSIPDDGENHSGYSKRSMAKDQVEVMEILGFDEFTVIAHDRGARVAHRLARDYQAKVQKAVFLDIVPLHYLYSNVDKQFATDYWHWFFLIQKEPMPEVVWGNSADFIMQAIFGSLSKSGTISDVILQDYTRITKHKPNLHAMIEDYRAGATIDMQIDESDMDVKLKMPVLVLWGLDGKMARYDVVNIWQERAADVRGHGIANAGHFMVEDNPKDTLAAIVEFLNEK
jgi:haloacetate dehalogenase